VTEASLILSDNRGVMLAKNVLVGVFMAILLFYISYVSTLSGHQIQAAHHTLCDIAKFSDTILYGNSDDPNAKWAGT